ncbi:MAG TPA: thiamine pyrophosphate-dependent enzyme [Gaiellales bacterium]|nr:thiamine pyrophosphate-dependent enzyme [Gaiellales bacterium]
MGAHAVLDIQQRCGVEHIFRSPGGGLGVGLVSALGMKFAVPSQPVVAPIGDGSFNTTRSRR